MVTAVLSFAVVAGVLSASPAVAGEVAPGAPPTAEQQNRFVAEGLAGTVSSLAASDADPSKFVDGDLVSDAVFFNGTAWSASTVQSLLNTKGASCPAGSNPVCLKSATFTTPSKAAGAACTSAYTGGSGKTAAQIFAGVGAACGINPAVLVALVQKEQGLVSTSAPTQWMYDHATGWNCPDVGADPQCDNTPTSTGFFNQVYGAAWQFKQYGADPYFAKRFPVGKVSPIGYNLDASCGTKQVAVQNKATRALYIYTPYTPNAASLASYPGEGDDCSAYGIRNFWMLFNAWYGSSTAGSVPSMNRIAGGDRFETAAAISRAAYPSPGAGVPAVYIANGLNFPDALAAAPAAAASGGPLLLVQTTAVPQVIMTELQRLKPKHIYVAGGVNVITDAVIGQLAKVQPAITRLGGYDRFNTSVVIAQRAFGTSASSAYVASGLGFADALSAGGAAGAKRQPVILVNGALGTVDAGTLQGLRSLGITNVTIVGGTTVISSGFQASLAKNGIAITRLQGSDRFATSIAVNANAFPGATTTSYFASGTSFPDALAGAAWAGKAGGPLLVTPVGCVYPGAAEQALRSKAIGLLGGVNALGPQVGALAVCQ
ncbi:cell wall-binding repeat-containing protein [Leifsonia sp. NPDC077715]|uniref:cell wall-binding repeat-containing protein n=1 Tax=Leifsonia sp. NPDC077715 TaxID=3155539 RepID=UPI00342C016C